MKLAPSVKFDKNSLQFIGFTDLGRYTPDEQKKKHGDHALVLMYQPFCGRWVQTLDSFLSCGAARGHVLSQILLEAIVLLENSGFYVDCAVTDGAQWNRGMWKEFGVTTNKPYWTHPVDDDRKLYFVSDFPHLVKCLWHWILKKKFIVVNFSYVLTLVPFQFSQFTDTSNLKI